MYIGNAFKAASDSVSKALIIPVSNYESKNSNPEKIKNAGLQDLSWVVFLGLESSKALPSALKPIPIEEAKHNSTCNIVISDSYGMYDTFFFS